LPDPRSIGTPSWCHTRLPPSFVRLKRLPDREVLS
jgi:hypothetical protein